MKRTFLIIFMASTMLLTGCYTRISGATEITPMDWQERHDRELNHVTDCTSCHRWHFYYHYPYWMDLGNGEPTGLERMASVGRAFLWTADLAFDIATIFDDIECSRDKDVNVKKILPEKRKIE